MGAPLRLLHEYWRKSMIIGEKNTEGAPMFLKFDPYRVWCSIFYSKLVNCILFKIIVQPVCFVKGRGTCGSGERKAVSLFGEPCTEINWRDIFGPSEFSCVVCRECVDSCFTRTLNDVYIFNCCQKKRIHTKWKQFCTPTLRDKKHELSKKTKL
jgi:hypothetical protein